jgi:uncharacterized protein
MDGIAKRKLKRLLSRLGSLRGVLVAFSGGADSAFLAAAAREALGRSAVAATAVSPSLPRAETALAKRFARKLGIRHLLVRTLETNNEAYLGNTTKRCYFCRGEMFKRLRETADRLGLESIAYGAVRDDRKEFRPGAAAAREAGVLAPLDDAGLSKAEVRALSRQWGLPTWDKPSSPCLASRIPYGVPITLERLARVERAEACLRGLGFRELRVRHHEEIARIEVPAEDMASLLRSPTRDRALTELRRAGYTWVTLDLAGFSSGSFDRSKKAGRREARGQAPADSTGTARPPSALRSRRKPASRRGS